MSDAAEFRKRAEECMGLIKRMAPDSHPMLLSIAEAWMALAHGAELKERPDDQQATAPSTSKLQ